MTNWIVCPTLNNLHLTQRAVKSFLAQDIENVGVLILDTGSTDGTEEWASSRIGADGCAWAFGRVRGNSVAQCWNRGIRYAMGKELVYHFDSSRTEEVGPDYVLVCNNDVELHPATYRLLVEDGGGFVTGVGVTPEQWDLKCAGDPGRWWSANPWSKRPHPDFSCFLIRRWVWEKVGQFDEAYKVGYVEDADYHLRMHRLGVGAYCIDVPFLHHASGTIKGASDEQAQRIMRQADKNRELFRSRHGCIPGSPEYTDLFRPETFGVDAHVAPVAEPD